uniref:Carboxylesterase type B domain-containing protein n=1 Tax=Acrobeloides nanus TaxID=290746 RepID=A0A914E6C2_9BILA
MWNSANYGALKTCLMNYDPIQLSSIASGVQGWKIMQDNYFLPDVPRNLWQKRPKIPRIMGTTKDEWAYYEIDSMNSGKTNFTDYSKKYFEAELELFASIIFGGQLQTSINIFEHMFVPPGTADDDHLAWLKATVDVFSAAAFSSGISKDIEFYLRNNNSDVYVYEFTWPGVVANKCKVKACEIPGWNPVVHASETKYVFMEESAWLSVNVSSTDYAMADFFGEAWTNFAKFGRPTLNDTWSPTTEIDVTKTEYLEIGQNMGMRVGYRTNQRIAWNAIVPSLVGVLPPEMPDYNNGSHVEGPTSGPTSVQPTQPGTEPIKNQGSTPPSSAINQRITGLLGNVLLIFSIIAALFGSTNTF